MNALWAAALRRHWAVLSAVTVLICFTLVHQLWFLPGAQRYTRALKDASDLGMALDPDQSPRLVPPRMFALISQNSRPAREAQEAAGSGSLTAEFIGEFSQLMERRNIQVISTEPGPMTQDARWVQMRTHLRARCRYADLVALFDDLARDQRLVAIERFNALPDAGGGLTIEMWASRFVLKSGGKP